MTTDDLTTGENLEKLNDNIVKIEELSARLVSAIANKRTYDQGLAGPGQDVYMKAAGAYWADMLANPSKMFEQQAAYWGQTLQHFVEAQRALAEGNLASPEDNTPSDRRFANPLWQTNPYFNFVKQQYSLNAAAVEKAVAGIEGLEPRDQQRVEFFSRQIIDAFAPTNFLATNPDALERAVETDGQSLVDGLNNLVRDIEASEGELLVTLADKDAFSVGKNIATTPGQVVFRNRMFELIQYAPTTEKVHKTPLVIFPPWINKFYILDLKEKNSLIKWVVDQGFTLFVVSWANPDASYADVGVDTYVEEGFLAAIDQVKEITGEKQVNAVGYCIAGTTLSMTLAYLAKKKDKSVKSATFFTTVTDFSDQREFTPFLSDDFVDGIEREASEAGYLDSFFMSRTFSYLRPNDLIYQPAIRSYMMGETPPAFDLLYWNGDSTNLPARMVIEYLRELCQENRFADKGIELLGERLHISDVNVPLTAVACETDHIANWQDSFRGVNMMGSKSKQLILSESGHIAGIVNPPSKKKYGHYTNDDNGLTQEDWREGATYNEGSWWPRWGEWLAKSAGAKVPARDIKDPICAAPGTYVLSREDEA
ncbi:Polyhydroxyalkanoic acid synthase [Candidatus Rhodobacter oscarellae]|uniref:Polyhydroxyalkanoic acid synthase n=1 Tax=Candidatus Rhodobacter oscarellae TaxID=1675527 RepID=A0A0J9EA61_9RHOB|nr:class I poly(R)-hydroxyalkanoic acid synthase [Candidatus Rhodobacter lobularis]KMW58559.1 Polyhydroxyalkanoic acid synthase [Candidatus Rhodobacter lobularis]